MSLVTATKAPFYSGWIVLAACFISAMLVIGGTIYSYQLFVIPVTAELGISRGSASNAFVALLVGVALWSPIIGRLYDTVSVKWLMPLGGAAFAAGFAILSQSSSHLIMLAAILVFLGLAMALAGGLAANTITARWFERRRGRALGIASIASSAGGFAMIPLMTWLIAELSWRNALLVSGLCIGMIIILIGLFAVRDRPDDFVMKHSGEFAQFSKTLETSNSDWNYASLAKSREFWLIAIGIGLLLASDQAVLTTQYPFLTDIGLSSVQAASIITAMTGSAIVGKLLVGYLAERIDIRWLYWMVAIFHAGLLAVFLIQPGFVAMLIFVSLFGAAVGGIYPVWSVMVLQHFGAGSFGLAFGSMALFTQILAIAFVFFINQSFDSDGTYVTAYSAFLVTILLGMTAIFFLRSVKSIPSIDKTLH